MRTYDYKDPWIPKRADPYVLKAHDGKYYFTASMPLYDSIALRTSDTLWGLNAAKEKEIWHCHENGPMSVHIWAPEMHYINGGWYIYFAAGEKEDIWKIRPYVLMCKGQNPMEDEWIELGPLMPSDEDEFSFRAFSLDTTVFFNKGEWYCIWAEKVGVGRQISNLYIAKMETPTKLKTVQVLLSSPDYEWERKGFWVNEGPFVLNRNGKIFVTYSASDTGVNYCVGMLTADENADLLDPGNWKKERTPVLKTDEKLELYGPGHNCFTVDEDGNDVMVFHVRKEKEIVGDPLYVANRHAMLLNVKYSDEGTPCFEFE